MKLMFRLCLLVATVSALSGCGASESNTQVASNGVMGLFGGTRVTVPSGAVFDVRLAQTISSETAQRGDRWEGVVVNSVIVDGRELIPDGAHVEGVVVAVQEARRGDRARLELGVRSVRIGDQQTSLTASTEPVIAGSTRARNLGAIAGGAIAGALIGEATSDKPGTGAVIGGAIATGAVAASKGYQVKLREGTVLTFVVSKDVAVRV